MKVKIMRIYRAVLFLGLVTFLGASMSHCEIMECPGGFLKFAGIGSGCGVNTGNGRLAMIGALALINNSTIQGIAAGGAHNCAWSSLGVFCFGSGGDGRLGYGNNSHIGNDELPFTAGPVNIGGPVTQLTAGAEHSCALLATGAVRCWGKGTEGRLGYGNERHIGNDELPASAGDVNVGGLVIQVSAGGEHTCAVLEGGTLRCWGRGANGRLGYGNESHIGNDELPFTAGDVNIGGSVTQVAAGGDFTCALLSAGAVRCFGNGADGRLGYGNENSIGDNEDPATAGDVNLGGRAVQISAGAAHACALLESGAIRCWGEGTEGRLGYGNENHIGNDETPASAGDINIGGIATQVSAGDVHTCVLLENGAVRCFGRGADGRLGYGNERHIGNDELPFTAGDVNVGGPALEVRAGGEHTCVRLVGGAVQCFGQNNEGQLGLGNTMDIGDNELPIVGGPARL